MANIYSLDARTMTLLSTMMKFKELETLCEVQKLNICDNRSLLTQRLDVGFSFELENMHSIEDLKRVNRFFDNYYDLLKIKDLQDEIAFFDMFGKYKSNFSVMFSIYFEDFNEIWLSSTFIPEDDDVRTYVFINKFIKTLIFNTSIDIYDFYYDINPNLEELNIMDNIIYSQSEILDNFSFETGDDEEIRPELINLFIKNTKRSGINLWKIHSAVQWERYDEDLPGLLDEMSFILNILEEEDYLSEDNYDLIEEWFKDMDRSYNIVKEGEYLRIYETGEFGKLYNKPVLRFEREDTDEWRKWSFKGMFSS